jgi:TRAP-type C4-dicarboxylate transport system permease small subunit
MKILKELLNILHIATVFISLILMGLLVIIIFTHVVLRYGFNTGISWYNEVSSQVLVPAFVFLGMALGVDEKIHISINIISKKIPEWLDTFLDKLKYVLYIFISLVMIYYGTLLVISTSRSILSSIEWPASLQYIIMPLSGILITIISVLFIFNTPKDEKWIDRYLENIEGAETLE